MAGANLCASGPLPSRAEPEELDDDSRATGALWSYRAGLLTNLANPKAAIFAMSFLPQFVPADTPKLMTMVLLAATWAVYEVFYYSLYVWCVQRLRTFFSRRKVRRRMEQISGTVMLGLAVRMVVENS